MHMLVTPMRYKGVALDLNARRHSRGIRGDVRVNCEIDTGMGRSSNVARLINGMPLDPELLPPLIDATLSGMAPNGFVLTGIEFIDGCAYAQFWWCRLV
ncbi:hypothetical protein [Pseudomonas gingeri]|uniref:hypothetical protein n=1 Tax=Pseudomonas gingeri TaxID=117681 RepID=UPI0015A0CAC5|nr:hypothetical protein [Pseudomonas gingeri]NWE26238.1 hypothetical protein [Pseudomonas gingeri]NWE95514.1 hypothetical protein [Pseudomonas gingeri]